MKDLKKAFLSWRRNALAANRPLGRVIRLAVLAAYVTAIIAFVYNCYHAKESPWVIMIETAAAFVMTHLVLKMFVEPPERAHEELKVLLSEVLEPVRKSIEDLESRLKAVETSQKASDDRLDDHNAYLQELEQHFKMLCDIIFVTNAPGGVRELVKVDFKDLFSKARTGETLWLSDTYIPNFFQYRESLKKAIERGVKFKFLVLNPECASAGCRPKEITKIQRLPHPIFTDGIREYWNILQEVAAEMNATRPGALQAKYYSGLPGVPIYLIEDPRHKARLAYQSFFLLQPSVHSLHLVWGTSPTDSILQDFYEYLEWKWRFDTESVNQPMAA